MAADGLLGRVGLRLRIAAVAAIAVGIALTIGAVVLVGLLRSRLDAAATTAASLRARDVAALAQAGALPRKLALPGEESALVQVVRRDGTVIASTENIEGEDAISTQRPPGTDPVLLTLVVPSLDEFARMRVIALNAVTPAGGVTIYAGESLERARATTAAITTVLAVGLPVLLAFVAAVTWWAVGRALRPVRSITRTMAEITASDLHRRVDAPAARDEIGRLATTVNDTLARLDTSVTKQRRFVADASHELRSPLAALRADLEISVTHPRRTDWERVARETLGDVERLQRLTEDLLMLARLDAKARHKDEAVDLFELVEESLATLRRTEIRVLAPRQEHPVIVAGDRDQLRRMVRNLVENAQAHASTTINISVGHDAGEARLVVADDGAGIPVDQRERIFERFVRLDASRTRDSGGTGLGLAIVSDVVAAHRGTITVGDSLPRGTTITVVLPAR